jgi:hypothetical protein
MAEFVVGLDLGTRHDYTALVIVEVLAEQPRHYAIRHVERQRGKEYHELAAWVRDRLQRPPLGPGLLARVQHSLGKAPPPPSTVHVVVDETGVGIAVTEILERAELGHPLIPCSITAGTGATEENRRWRVAKSLLVSTIDALLDTGRLTIGRQVAGRETLIAELQGFRRKYTASANEVFGNGRDTPHDDLVLATALACWASEHGPAQRAGVWFVDGRSEVDPTTGEFWW